MLNMTHLSLFSGIGGLDLAAEWAGFTTVGQCEWADYPTKVLEKHWPDVPRWRDIRTLTGSDFYGRTGLRAVDVISGGFPCQPFSVAGNQKGKGDDRYLWPEMLRVIRELAPRWVVGENVPGILSIAADDVCADLEREGYEVGILNFEAAAVGAVHRRERVFFVANRHGDSCESRRPEPAGQQREAGLTDGSYDVADTKIKRLEGRMCGWDGRTHKSGFGESCRAIISHWSVEPNVGRVANGISHRVDRLKCLGNAVVPQQAYPIFRAIAEIEQEL